MVRCRLGTRGQRRTTRSVSYIFQATQSWPPITTLWVLAESGVEPQQLTDGPMSFGNPWPAENDKICLLHLPGDAELATDHDVVGFGGKRCRAAAADGWSDVVWEPVASGERQDLSL